MLNRLLILVWILGLFWSGIPVSAASSTAILLEVKGPIGPATVGYVEGVLKQASQQQTPLLILQLDTPGGLDISMREIIQQLMTSPVPVVTYVGPSGARAASAGTYILYASHIAAMAPGTNLGSATPVQLGATPSPETLETFEDNSSSSGSTAMERKIINDAEAYLRSLAQLRGRNVEWAVQAVRKGASLSAEEALQQNVIDLIAAHVPDLLTKLDGREVRLLHEKHVLQTSGLTVKRIEPDWHNELLALMLIGIYGLIFEFSTPGSLLPGIVGTVSLVLALYAFQILPISYAGLALMLLGLALMIAEAFAPSFGILGIGGGLAFVIGSIILMDTDAPGYGLSPVLVGVLGLANLAFFAFVLGAVIQARKRPVVSGAKTMVGAKAVALESFELEGQVRTQGEIWQARSNIPVEAEQVLKITGTDGLVLLVTPLNSQEEI